MRPAPQVAPTAMMTASGPFVGRPLSPRQVAQAFPLLALAGSGMGAEHWRRLALALLTEAAPPPSGIMTLQNESGYILGLFRFRVVAEAAGATLRVDDLWALDLFDRSLALSLAELLDELAGEHRCVAIDVALAPPDKESELHRRLCDAGYQATARSLRKAVGFVAWTAAP